MNRFLWAHNSNHQNEQSSDILLEQNFSVSDDKISCKNWQLLGKTLLRQNYLFTIHSPGGKMFEISYLLHGIFVAKFLTDHEMYKLSERKPILVR